MRTPSIAIGVIALLTATATSASGDIRKLSWNEVAASSPNACLGRVVALYALESQAGFPSVLASVVTSEAVRGTCPPTFDVRATDFWEVLETPDRISVEYLFFLSEPTLSVAGQSAYEMRSRLAWLRMLGYSCDGTEVRYYAPSYVNFPDDLRIKQCIGRFRSDPDPVREARIVPEALLFSRLRIPPVKP